MPKKKNTALREELRQQRKVIFGNRRYWFHIAIWSLVILYTFVYYGSSIDGFNNGIRINGGGRFSQLSMPMTLTGIAIGSLMAAAMVYFFLLLAIAYARYKEQKRYLVLGVLVNMAVWLGTLILAQRLTEAAVHAPLKGNAESAVFIAYVAVFSLVLSAYFFSIYYFIDLYDQQKNLARFQQVFTEKLQAETNFLKTQINPHFLFNTLNNIYSLTLAKSEDAPRITARLKELISYMVHECAHERVELSGELNFLKNYVALEQLRTQANHTTIQLEVVGDTDGKVIAPLLLINFIENAFKHGVKAGTAASFVHVQLQVQGQRLLMDVVNSKPSEQDQALAIAHRGGIGIRNVKRRLELLYPNKHKLKITESATEYKVQLNILL